MGSLISRFPCGLEPGNEATYTGYSVHCKYHSTKKEMHTDTNLSKVWALNEDGWLKRHLVRPFAGVPRNVWDFHFNTLQKLQLLWCNNATVMLHVTMVTRQYVWMHWNYSCITQTMSRDIIHWVMWFGCISRTSGWGKFVMVTRKGSNTAMALGQEKVRIFWREKRLLVGSACSTSHFMDSKPHWLMNKLSVYLYSHIVCSHISYCHVPILHTPYSILPSHYIPTVCGSSRDRYVCDIVPCCCSV